MKSRASLRLVLGCFLALALALSWKVSFAQRDPSRFFPETGHTVEGEFLEYYESFPNPELIFGFPVSRQFEDSLLQRELQYFQRARFELVAGEDGGLQVELSPLGDLLYTSGQNGRMDTGSAGCRSYQNPDTNAEQQVCYAFLEYFERHGGIALFGYPISNFELEDGRIVQYFQNTILSWHPELPGGQKVQLVDSGSIYFSRVGENRELLNPDESGRTLRSLLGLKVRAFTEKALLADGDLQTLYVIVQDQKLQAVEGAQVKFILDLPNGETMAILMPPTDENGISKFSLTIDTEGEIGLATFEVIASILNHEDHTQTSFRVWW
ncbi:MAG TPA: hypothetical protein VJ768_07010 [Anaerolineales bacterium]|nr:hypothetical protein [Anaerolineales bacterium]